MFGPLTATTVHLRPSENSSDERSFRRLDSPPVRVSDVAQRLALVEQTAELPSASARRLLRLMLEDSHADIRLRALTTLATTNDPQLASLAKEITLRDKDPRVADLAAELMRK